MGSRIVENMDRADTMIRDLLDASSIRSGERISLVFSEIEVTQVVRDAIAHLESVHGESFILEAPSSGF